MNMNGFIDKLKKIKGIKFLLALFAVGIVLIIVASCQEEADAPLQESFDEDAYRTKLEASLCELIEHVDGAGKASVAVTLGSGKVSVFLYDESERKTGDSSEVQRSVVFSDSGSGNTPVFAYEEMPRLKGVGVVCEGGGNDAVRKKITELVASLTGLSYNRIYVTQ